jgi:hypothetical protein
MTDDAVVMQWETVVGIQIDRVDTPLPKGEGILDSQNRLADAELLQHR